ncbi:MAG: hypothetical protein QG577_1076 [Thermodesulfobacteriota bacterium]|nr:hypothetical protein [Thermodesulfobacteriota bacterium]
MRVDTILIRARKQLSVVASQLGMADILRKNVLLAGFHAFRSYKRKELE